MINIQWVEPGLGSGLASEKDTHNIVKNSSHRLKAMLADSGTQQRVVQTCMWRHDGCHTSSVPTIRIHSLFSE